MSPIPWGEPTQQERGLAALVKSAALSAADQYGVDVPAALGLSTIEWRTMRETPWSIRTALHVAEALNLAVEASVYLLTPQSPEHPAHDPDAPALTHGGDPKKVH